MVSLDHSLGLDLDQVVADQPTDLEHRVRGPDRSEPSAVGA
jgi:hypothetical protein